MSKPRFIIEQDILIPRDEGNISVGIRIGEPVLSEDKDGDTFWICPIQLQGLYDKLNPAGGLTSFGAMMHALIGTYQLLDDVVGPKGKVIALNLRTTEPHRPDDYITLKELFQFGGIRR